MRIYKEMQKNRCMYSTLPKQVSPVLRLDVPRRSSLFPSESRMCWFGSRISCLSCWFLSCRGWLLHHAAHCSPAWPCPTFNTVPVSNLSMWGMAGDPSNLRSLCTQMEVTEKTRTTTKNPPGCCHGCAPCI